MVDLNANEKSIKPQTLTLEALIPLFWVKRQMKISVNHNKSVRSVYHKPGPQSSILS